MRAVKRWLFPRKNEAKTTLHISFRFGTLKQMWKMRKYAMAYTTLPATPLNEPSKRRLVVTLVWFMKTYQWILMK